MKYDIIIIGAGAAGLLAMKDLLETGYRVCLLEASAIAGGRIASIKENGFAEPVETGAEFIHGKLPLTLELLQEANIAYVPVEGKMIAVQNGEWKKNEAHDKHWKAFMRQLGKLKTDMSIAAFLEQYFSDSRYAGLRAAVQHYAEGFDLADITKASAMAAHREWNNEGETQYRIPAGYIQLINFLLQKCQHQHAVIHFSTCAAQIAYNKESVTVLTTDKRQFEASKLIITVSAGVLQSETLKFAPALDNNYAAAIQQLDYGNVIKIILRFTTPFWKKYETDIGFLLSNETIPTWWTQLPVENNLLTGWLGGPAATLQSTGTEASLLQSALLSLSAIFHLSPAELQQQLVHYKISSWHNHPYIKAGYSYVSIDSANAKKIAAHPVEGSIFFAGEAFFRGESQGTVEAALQSGRIAAKMIRDCMQYTQSVYISGI